MAAELKKKLDDQYFLTPSETAELLGVTLEDLRKMRASRTGPRFIALTSRCVRYFASQLKDWKQETL